MSRRQWDAAGTFDPYFSVKTIPDMYSRPDLLSPGAVQVIAAPGQMVAPADQPSGAGDMTDPGQRPTVIQRGQNFGLTVPLAPATIAIVASRLEVDGFIVDNPSTALQSVWLGYGSGVQVGQGIEVLPGVPMFISPNNTRELWEIQRVLEYIAGLLAGQVGEQPPANYKAPRVTLDASQWFLTAPTSAQLISILLFNVPEQQ